MWNVKAEVIQVIRGITASIPKPLTQYLSNIPGKHAIEELQITATLVTAQTHCGKC